MSLFSRIDRLRGGAGASRGDDRDEDSVFAIPDLSSKSAPPSDGDEEVSAPAPETAPRSPFARNATRADAPVAFEAHDAKSLSPRSEVAPSPRAEAAPRVEAAPRAEVAPPRAEAASPRAEVAPRAEAAPRAETAPRAEAAPRAETASPRAEVIPAPRSEATTPRREGAGVPSVEGRPVNTQKRLSPLERLAQRGADKEDESPVSSSLPDPMTPELANPQPRTASSLSERLKSEPLPDVAAPVSPTERLATREESDPSIRADLDDALAPPKSAPDDEVLLSRSRGPFRRPALFDGPPNEADSEPERASLSGASPEVVVPKESAAQRLARDERARTGAFAPESVRAREAEIQSNTSPSVEVPAAGSGGTAFDRLMAARAGTGAEAVKEAPRSGAPTLAERLAAMRAQNEAQDEAESVPPQSQSVTFAPRLERPVPEPEASAPDSPARTPMERMSAEAPVAASVANQAASVALPVSSLDLNTASPANQEEVRVEAARAEEIRAEEARAEQERAEEVRAETARAEQEQAEQARAEQEQAEQAQVEAARAEQARVEQAQVEAARAEQQRVETARAEQEQAEQARAEEMRAEETRLEAARAEETRAEAARAEQVRAEELAAQAARLESQNAAKSAQPESAPVAPQNMPLIEDAAPVAPPLPWNAPSAEEAPVPLETPASRLEARLSQMEPTSSGAAPATASLWAQRLAGRDALRDTSLAPAEAIAPAPASAPDAPLADETLDRAAGPLARTGGEGVAGEAEGRNRALYRQKHFIFDAVLGALDARTLQNATRESVKPVIERAVDSATREFNLSLDQADRNWMIEEFVREVIDLGPLVGLLEDVSVNKVLVVGSTDVAVERLGRIERTGVSFRDDDHLLSVVRRIAELTGGRIDAKVPLLDRPLPDGARIRAKIPPLSPQPTLTVEKSTGNPFLALKRQQAERGRENALPYAQLRERIQQRLLREFEGNAAALGNPERLRTQVEEMIGVVIAEEKVAVTRAERASLVMDLLNEIVGLGPIEPLLNDPEVDEVMVNGPFQIYVERKGKLEIAPQRFRDNAHVMQVIERIVAPLGRRVDEKSPMVDGRLRDGSRFNAIIPPLALGGPTMTIRKFARDPLTMTDLINFGSLSREAAQFLQAAVEGRLNIIVSGGTGSGKTTTLNVLSSFIPSTERIVTIEDAAELQLRQEHIVRLETRPANIEGAGEIAIRDLVRNSLRMRPDRIVIGECRGGEALDMLQAMNTGHDGSLTTAHSNGPRDTVKRLETMVMMSGFDLPVRAIREQISMAVHLIVHQERMRDGKRRITAVTELVGMEGEVVTMQDIFRFEQERVDEEGRIIGTLAATGLRPHNYDHIVDNGGQISMDMFQPRSMGGRDGDLRSRLSEHRVGTR